jgi:hypothetical protein
MSGTLVPTRLFRLGRPLDLTRPGARWPDAGPPAVLVIPRGGPLREPRLMVLGDGPVRSEGEPGPLDFADVHVTAVHTGGVRRHRRDRPGRDRAEVADVLLDGCGGPPGRLRALLERYPGCYVATGTGLCGPAAAIRDADPRGSGFRLFTTSGGDGTHALWTAIAGSFLYAWSAAGLAPDELCRAVLITGGLAVPDRGGRWTLLVAGGVRWHAAGWDGREATS